MTEALEYLGPAKRACDHCGRDLTASYYSMTPGFSDEWRPLQRPVCNECIIMGNPGPRTGYRHLFPLPKDRDTGWRKRAACRVENARPLMTERERQNPTATLDLAMFPQTTVARNARLWDKYCDRCPVKRKCAAFGRLSGSSGVWGGEYLYGHGEGPAIEIDKRLADAYGSGCRSESEPDNTVDRMINDFMEERA